MAASVSFCESWSAGVGAIKMPLTANPTLRMVFLSSIDEAGEEGEEGRMGYLISQTRKPQ